MGYHCLMGIRPPTKRREFLLIPISARGPSTGGLRATEDRQSDKIKEESESERAPVNRIVCQRMERYLLIFSLCTIDRQTRRCAVLLRRWTRFALVHLPMCVAIPFSTAFADWAICRRLTHCTFCELCYLVNTFFKEGWSEGHCLLQRIDRA